MKIRSSTLFINLLNFLFMEKEKEDMLWYIEELKRNSRVFVTEFENIKFIMYVLIHEGRKFYDKLKCEDFCSEGKNFKCYSL